MDLEVLNMLIARLLFVIGRGGIVILGETLLAWIAGLSDPLRSGPGRAHPFFVICSGSTSAD